MPSSPSVSKAPPPSQSPLPSDSRSQSFGAYRRFWDSKDRGKKEETPPDEGPNASAASYSLDASPIAAVSRTLATPPNKASAGAGAAKTTITPGNEATPKRLGRRSGGGGAASGTALRQPSLYSDDGTARADASLASSMAKGNVRKAALGATFSTPRINKLKDFLREMKLEAYLPAMVRSDDGHHNQNSLIALTNAAARSG